MINPLLELWNLFRKTKDDNNNKKQVGFSINEHLWSLWCANCSSKNQKPNQAIEPLIESYLRTELNIHDTEKKSKE